MHQLGKTVVALAVVFSLTLTADLHAGTPPFQGTTNVQGIGFVSLDSIVTLPFGAGWQRIDYDGVAPLTINTFFATGIDTEIGLYDSDGTLLATNDDASGTDQSEIVMNDIPQGTYYLAVALFNATFADNFSVTSNSFVTQTILVTTSTANAPTTETTMEIIGYFESEVVASALPVGQVVFFEVEFSDVADLTINTYGSDFDTEIALYSSAGHLVVTNDDASGTLQSEIVINVRETFGWSGRFYIALGRYDTTFENDRLSATTNNPGGGNYVLNVFTLDPVFNSTLSPIGYEDSQTLSGIQIPSGEAVFVQLDYDGVAPLALTIDALDGDLSFGLFNETGTPVYEQYLTAGHSHEVDLDQLVPVDPATYYIACTGCAHGSFYDDFVIDNLDNYCDAVTATLSVATGNLQISGNILILGPIGGADSSQTVSASVGAGEVLIYELHYNSWSQSGEGSFLTIDTLGSNFDTEIGLYDDAGNLIAFDDSGSSGNLSRIRISGLQAGIYYVALGGFDTVFGATNWAAGTSSDSSFGTATLSLAMDIPLPGGIDPVSTMAELQPGEVVFFELYSWGGSLKVDTEGSDFDTDLGIYDEFGNLLANDDNGGSGQTSLIFFEELERGFYYIALGGNDTTFGATNFEAVADVNSAAGQAVLNRDSGIPIEDSFSPVGYGYSSSVNGVVTPLFTSVHYGIEYDGIAPLSVTVVPDDDLQPIMFLVDENEEVVEQWWSESGVAHVVDVPAGNYFLCCISNLPDDGGTFQLTISTAPLPISGGFSPSGFGFEQQQSVTVGTEEVLFYEVNYDGIAPLSIEAESTGQIPELGIYNDNGDLVEVASPGGNSAILQFPDLPVGTYFIALGLLETDFGPTHFAASSTSLQSGQVLVSVTTPVLLGDVNRDNEVNLLDIDPFIEVLGTGGYQVEADTNGDGVVNLLDIDPFIAIVAGG